MTIVALIRTLGALAAVLAMLGIALWASRRFDLKLPGRLGAGANKRIEVIERLAIDPKRSLLLIRRDQAEHLVLMGPDGSVELSGGPDAPGWRAAFPPAPLAAERVTAVGGTFAFPGYLDTSVRLLARRLTADD